MRPHHYVLIAALLALVAKLYCAATTIGTNDTVFFNGFGKRINANGLAHTYETVKIFNHTPLVGGYAALLQRNEPGKSIAEWETLPFFLRLPGIVADFLSVLVLLRLRKITGHPPLWALIMFALSPVAFMVSGYHGNVDSVLALLLLVSAWMVVENNPLLCGLALGLACNVKVSPLLLGPVFFLWWWQHKGWKPFGITVVLTTLSGWTPALIGAPKEFLGNVLGYQGYWGIWGISYWLKATGAVDLQKVGFDQLSGIQVAVMTGTKYLIIGSTLALAWWRRKTDGLGFFTTLSLVWGLFFVFATGVAPQYFVWMLPFVLVAAPRWHAAIMVAASVFLFVFYNTISNNSPWVAPWERPWFVGNSQNQHIALWGPWQTLPWLMVLGCLGWMLARALKDGRKTAPSQETQG